MIRIGTAGWAIRREHAALFGNGASHLTRYATRFNAVEINSSFYRSHRPSTYARWARSVPDDFRFSAKLPKAITHTKRLRGVAKELAAFLSEVTALGDRLGPLLVQLPPSLVFERSAIDAFAARLREAFAGQVVWESRHVSWFTGEADVLLTKHAMARAAVDPALVPAASTPGGSNRLGYWRLHGSPRMYYSDYTPAFLDALAERLPGRGESWVIFDNTALGFATSNAFALQQKLR